MLAGNFTQTSLFGKIKTAEKLSVDITNMNTLFGRYEKGRMDYGQPNDKIILSHSYKWKKLKYSIRNTHFGRMKILSSDFSHNNDEYLSSKILTDMSFSFAPVKWLNIIASVNIFNVYPDLLQDYRNTKDGILLYGMEATPFGFYRGVYSSEHSHE